MTKNIKKSIQYRIRFLQDVLEEHKSPNQTLYYHFMADEDQGIVSNTDMICARFIDLYNDIKKNGIKQPIPVGKYDQKIIKIRYILKGKK